MMLPRQSSNIARPNAPPKPSPRTKIPEPSLQTTIPYPSPQTKLPTALKLQKAHSFQENERPSPQVVKNKQGPNSRIPNSKTPLSDANGADPHVSIAELTENHDNIISLILSEEENLIACHRQHIDTVVEMVKQEMSLLHDIDKPGSDIEFYLNSLDEMLSYKEKLAGQLRGKVDGFKRHLKQEKELSSQISKEMNLFDLKGGSDDLLSDPLI